MAAGRLAFRREDAPNLLFYIWLYEDSMLLGPAGQLRKHFTGEWMYDCKGCGVTLDAGNTKQLTDALTSLNTQAQNNVPDSELRP
jgi:hypothetical protein